MLKTNYLFQKVRVHLPLPYSIVAILAAVCGGLCFLLPESKDMPTLEDMDSVNKDPVSKADNTKSGNPPTLLNQLSSLIKASKRKIDSLILVTQYSHDCHKWDYRNCQDFSWRRDINEYVGKFQTCPGPSLNFTKHQLVDSIFSLNS